VSSTDQCMWTIYNFEQLAFLSIQSRLHPSHSWNLKAALKFSSLICPHSFGFSCSIQIYYIEYRWSRPDVTTQCHKNGHVFILLFSSCYFIKFDLIAILSILIPRLHLSRTYDELTLPT